ncbi:MAG: hypothetical protein PHD05_03055 [Sphaerochaetaceae bacterium]|nr:hypothetical protein [Sphaerochaetaceae bacterium]
MGVKFVSLFLLCSFLVLLGCTQSQICGDSSCNGSETAVSCPVDCIDEKDLVVTGISKSDLSLTAGEQKEYILKVKNNNNLRSIYDLKIEFVPYEGYENCLSCFL